MYVYVYIHTHTLDLSLCKVYTLWKSCILNLQKENTHDGRTEICSTHFCCILWARFTHFVSLLLYGSLIKESKGRKGWHATYLETNGTKKQVEWQAGIMLYAGPSDMCKRSSLIPETKPEDHLNRGRGNVVSTSWLQNCVVSIPIPPIMRMYTVLHSQEPSVYVCMCTEWKTQKKNTDRFTLHIFLKM